MSPAFVVVAAGGFLFYWLRNRIKQRKVERGSTFVASPTALVVREQTVPRASIEEVSWCDHSHQSTGTRVINGEYRPDLSTGDQLHRESSLSVETIRAGSIALAAVMDAGTAEQLAIDLGRALGGVKVSAGRFRLPN